MSNNLFISYDLNSPEQNCSDVIEKIHSLGSCAQIQESHWFVSSNLTSSQACNQVWTLMSSNDSLIVIDASNGNASSQNILSDSSKHIKKCWTQ